MEFKMKVGTTISALALATGALAATAVPAQAVGGCPEAKLCLYTGTNFTGLAFTAASTAACFDLRNYAGLDGNVRSYVNNLPVKATLWYYYSSSSVTIRSGGFSSNSSGTEVEDAYWVCTGDAA
ncbi:peptidase inhibitor family I36 protein [Streptomyces griseoruber]|uniref:peptidase inhibitor family I36 protein n=1 Tax=Streptomyces griseoruber TaxID=1943 RepID=UPI00099E4302|nr:peptidase inhibitor family I36 protein [Streptomyces griseoruber]